MKKILVVEDEELLAREVTQELVEAGYECRWVKDGKECLEFMGHEEVGLVLLDVMLPGLMDGFQVLEKIKQNQSFSQVPVVMMSNLDVESGIAKSTKLGANEYVVKSKLDISELPQIVQKYFKTS